MHYRPRFYYIDTIVNLLSHLEYCKEIVNNTVLPVELSENLRQKAKIKATHYSTAIEGDLFKAKHYQNALNYLSWAKSRKVPVSVEFIKKVHAIINVKHPVWLGGKSNYRGPSLPGVLYAVWDRETGTPVYFPPSYRDIPGLMNALVNWLHSKESLEIPVPVRAAIFAYQLVTIHPFNDGNGRLSRAMASYIIMLDGYDLHGYYLVEEHYASDLKKYYTSLQMELPANYYEGRNNPDLTTWISFFLTSMSNAYTSIVGTIHDLQRRVK